LILLISTSWVARPTGLNIAFGPYFLWYCSSTDLVFDLLLFSKNFKYIIRFSFKSSLIFWCRQPWLQIFLLTLSLLCPTETGKLCFYFYLDTEILQFLC
jgi:hypothetical protein